MTSQLGYFGISILPSIVPPEVCDNVVKFAKEKGFEAGKISLVGNQEGTYSSIRSACASKVSNNDWPHLLIKKCAEVSQVAKQLSFPITTSSQSQVVHYGVGDFYVWHTDTKYATKFPRVGERILTVVIVLSSTPNDYLGGQLEFIKENTATPMRFIELKKKGSAVVFLSDIPHQVTPIALGERYVLTGWMRREG